MDKGDEGFNSLEHFINRTTSGTKDMRKEHDVLPSWIFDKDPSKKGFTKGSDSMNRADMEVAMDMFYGEMGWDKTTGAPTKATLLKFGLADVAEALDKKGLLVG
jgi:aldehyde:ferredoxin oxidoreductase